MRCAALSCAPQELLTFAESNPEAAEAAFEAVSRGCEVNGELDEDSTPGASLARAAARSAASRAAAPPADWEELTPQAGFVVKTRDTARGVKVMFNVCSSPLVSAPGDWAHGQVPLAVKEALEAADDGAVALRLPLSSGAPREAADESGGEAVTVLDVVFAEAVVAASHSDARLKSFLVGTLLAHAAAKHGWALDPQYKLPRRKVFDGPPRVQRVRAAPRAPLVAELPAAERDDEPPSFALRFETAAPPAAPAAAQEPASAPAVALEFQGRPVEVMLLRLPLPRAAAACARLQLSRDELRLQGLAGACLATVPLPFEVDAHAATAWLEEEEQAGGALLLRARLPVLPYSQAVRAAQGRLGAQHLSSDAYLELID